MLHERMKLAIAVAAVAVVVPLLLTTSQLNVFILACLATIVCCGLTLLVGFSGQVSLGHAAFYAIGAYTAALLARDLHVAPLLALTAAPLSSGATAIIIGWPLLRLRGHALSFGTLALQLVSLSIISQAKTITGGDIGLAEVPALGLGEFTLTGPAKSLEFAYGCCALPLATTPSMPGTTLSQSAASSLSDVWTMSCRHA
jgi:branched-chain amino acid transport system permease protein